MLRLVERRSIILLSLVIAPYLWMTNRLWFVCDDAFISFRYAKNLANGHGLRFNIGDHTPVEGFSNLLWVLIAAVFEAIGADTPLWMTRVSALCGLGLLVYLFGALRRHWGLSPAMAALTTSLVSTSGAFCVWATGGLATMPLTLLVFAVFERLVLSRSRAAMLQACVLGALLVLIRAEGFGWALVIGIIAFWTRRGVSSDRDRKMWPYFSAVLITLGVLLAWRLSTYGAWMPNTASAKVSAGLDVWRRGMFYVLSFWLALLTPFLCFLGSPFAIRDHGRKGFAVFVMATAFPVYGVVVGGDFMTFGRFLIPGLPFAAMLMGVLFERGLRRTKLRPLVYAFGAFCIVAQVLPTIFHADPDDGAKLATDKGIHLVPLSVRSTFHFRWNTFVSDLHLWQGMRSRAWKWGEQGRFFGEKFGEGATIVRGGIGAFGYYSDLFIYDTYGLVSDHHKLGIVKQSVAHKGNAPGHDQHTSNWSFLGLAPTILIQKFEDEGNPISLLRKALRSWAAEASIRGTYAPSLDILSGLDPKGSLSVALTLKRVVDPEENKLAWAQAHADLLQLNHMRLGFSTDGSAPQRVPQLISTGPAVAGSHPNVLVILWHATRADRLSAYGYERPTTPWLRGFIKDAVRFDRAITPVLQVGAAQGSLFTGLSASKHAMTPHNLGVLGEEMTTLATCFGARGFDTFMFDANRAAKPTNGLLRGFGVIDRPWSQRWKKLSKRVTTLKLDDRDESTVFYTGGLAGRNRSAVLTSGIKDAGPVAWRTLTAWLDRRTTDSPWLAYVSFVEAKTPRTPDINSRRMLFDTGQIQAQHQLNQVIQNQHLYNFGLYPYSPEDLETIGQVYDATLRDMDTATAKLFDVLRDQGVLDDTIVVITSDKGVHLGEHGLLGARYGLYDTAVHVPLVIWYPSQLPPGRVQTTVSTRAVYPTLVDLAGLEPCPGDLLPSLLDAEVTSSVVVSELLSPKTGQWERLQRRHRSTDLTPWERTYRSIEADGYKLIRSSLGELQLFHPASDPKEAVNLVAEQPAQAAAMEQLLDDWIEEERTASVPAGAAR